MKVKTFIAFSEKSLDKKVNDFISSNNSEIIDIKFSSSFLYLSAMIIIDNQI